MIPVEQKRDVSSSGVEGSASFEISTKDQAHLMTILRDTLYSDKVLAVLREYAANAWDANRMAGRGDRPIEVTLPTYKDPTLKIRDFGPGLSLNDVFEVYNKYGASTKRDSNVAVGMLGIGSKSGFAYSDSFTIVSVHGGKRMTFVAVIDSSEKGRVDLLCTEEGVTDETGVEIQIAVKPQDIGEFERKAANLFTFFNPRPKINITLPEVPKGKDFLGLGTILESKTTYGDSRGWWAVMGCVPYKINVNQLTGLSNSARNVSGILYFDIGMLQVAASREELKYGDSTKNVLTERINTIIDRYVEHLLEGVDKLSQWERRLRVKQINEMYLPLPGNLKGLSESYIVFDNDPAFKLKSKGYRGKFDNSSGIRVQSDSRLVFRNEKRVLQGYEFQPHDIIVDPVDEKLARAALAKHIAKHLIEGIPMVNISTLKWTKPLTAPRQVDLARARAYCLILNPQAIGADRKSERWNPVTRIPQDTDVYVVLDAYQVSTFSDFYETYQNDAIILEKSGGVMPQIIGYRHTQANPVVRSKLKGKDYKEWRDDEYVKLLMKQQGVADGIRAKVWSDVTVYGLYADHIKIVGEQHPVGKYLANVLNGKTAWYKVEDKYKHAINRAFLSLKENEAKKAWKELLGLYPLFSVMGPEHMSHVFIDHIAKWNDYIKTTDRLREAERILNEMKESAA